MSKSSRKNGVGTLLACLLVSRKDTPTIDSLDKDYYDEAGEHIPYRELGYGSLLEFLQSIPKHVRIERRAGGIYHVLPVVSEKVEHVQSLVVRQKSTSKPSAIRRRFRHSQYYPAVRPSRTFFSIDWNKEIVNIVGSYPDGLNRNFLLQKLQNLRSLPLGATLGDLERQLQNLEHLLVFSGNQVRLRRPNEESGVAKIPSLLAVKTEKPRESPKPSLIINTIPGGLEEDAEIVEEPPRPLPFNLKPAGCTERFFGDSDRTIGSFTRRATTRPEEQQPRETKRQDLDEGRCGERNRNDWPANEEARRFGWEAKYRDGTAEVEDKVDRKQAHFREIGTFCKIEKEDGEDQDCLYYSDDEFTAAINPRVKFRLEKLLESHPDGILCEELLSKYFDAYHVTLDYKDMGFASLIELVGGLPNIFHYVELNDSGSYMLFDAKKPVPQIKRTSRLSSSKWDEFYSSFEQESGPFPMVLSEPMAKSLIPGDVMTLGESVGQVLVTDLVTTDKDFVEALIAEVFTPSCFWMQLRKNHQKLVKLMAVMQDFYEREGDDYIIPPVVMEKGLNCACVYETEWHRAIIKSVKPDGNVELNFYDFGTLKSYGPNDLRFLHSSFSGLPAQAIPCGLYNVKPAIGDRWTRGVSVEFLNKVASIPLVAIIVKTDAENNSMLVSLTDTQKEDDLHINDWMVEQRFAVFGSMVRTRPRNFIFRHYLECEKNKRSKIGSRALSTTNARNVNSTSDNIPESESATSPAKVRMVKRKSKKSSRNESVNFVRTESGDGKNKSFGITGVSNSNDSTSGRSSVSSHLDTSKSEYSSEKLSNGQNEIPEFGTFHSMYGGQGQMLSVDWEKIRRSLSADARTEPEALTKSPAKIIPQCNSFDLLEEFSGVPADRTDGRTPPKTLSEILSPDSQSAREKALSLLKRKLAKRVPTAGEYFLNAVMLSKSEYTRVNGGRMIWLPEGNIEKRPGVITGLLRTRRRNSEESHFPRAEIIIPPDVLSIIQGKAAEKTIPPSHLDVHSTPQDGNKRERDPDQSMDSRKETPVELEESISEEGSLRKLQIDSPSDSYSYFKEMVLLRQRARRRRGTEIMRNDDSQNVSGMTLEKDNSQASAELHSVDSSESMEDNCFGESGYDASSETNLSSMERTKVGGQNAAGEQNEMNNTTLEDIEGEDLLGPEQTGAFNNSTENNLCAGVRQINSDVKCDRSLNDTSDSSRISNKSKLALFLRISNDDKEKRRHSESNAKTLNVSTPVNEYQNLAQSLNPESSSSPRTSTGNRLERFMRIAQSIEKLKPNKSPARYEQAEEHLGALQKKMDDSSFNDKIEHCANESYNAVETLISGTSKSPRSEVPVSKLNENFMSIPQSIVKFKPDESTNSEKHSEDFNESQNEIQLPSSAPISSSAMLSDSDVAVTSQCSSSKGGVNRLKNFTNIVESIEKLKPKNSSARFELEEKQLDSVYPDLQREQEDSSVREKIEPSPSSVDSKINLSAMESQNLVKSLTSETSSSSAPEPPRSLLEVPMVNQTGSTKSPQKRLENFMRLAKSIEKLKPNESPARFERAKKQLDSVYPDLQGEHEDNSFVKVQKDHSPKETTDSGNKSNQVKRRLDAGFEKNPPKDPAGALDANYSILPVIVESEVSIKIHGANVEKSPNTPEPKPENSKLIGKLPDSQFPSSKTRDSDDCTSPDVTPGEISISMESSMSEDESKTPDKTDKCSATQNFDVQSSKSFVPLRKVSAADADLDSDDIGQSYSNDSESDESFIVVPKEKNLEETPEILEKTEESHVQKISDAPSGSAGGIGIQEKLTVTEIQDSSSSQTEAKGFRRENSKVYAPVFNDLELDDEEAVWIDFMESQEFAQLHNIIMGQGATGKLAIESVDECENVTNDSNNTEMPEEDNKVKLISIEERSSDSLEFAEAETSIPDGDSSKVLCENNENAQSYVSNSKDIPECFGSNCKSEEARKVNLINEEETSSDSMEFAQTEASIPVNVNCESNENASLTGETNFREIPKNLGSKLTVNSDKFFSKHKHNEFNPRGRKKQSLFDLWKATKLLNDEVHSIVSETICQHDIDMLNESAANDNTTESDQETFPDLEKTSMSSERFNVSGTHCDFASTALAVTEKSRSADKSSKYLDSSDSSEKKLPAWKHRVFTDAKSVKRPSEPMPNREIRNSEKQDYEAAMSGTSFQDARDSCRSSGDDSKEETVKERVETPKKNLSILTEVKKHKLSVKSPSDSQRRKKSDDDSIDNNENSSTVSYASSIIDTLKSYYKWQK